MKDVVVNVWSHLCTAPPPPEVPLLLRDVICQRLLVLSVFLIVAVGEDGGNKPDPQALKPLTECALGFTLRIWVHYPPSILEEQHRLISLVVSKVPSC